GPSRRVDQGQCVPSLVEPAFAAAFGDPPPCPAGPGHAFWATEPDHAFWPTEPDRALWATEADHALWLAELPARAPPSSFSGAVSGSAGATCTCGCQPPCARRGQPPSQPMGWMATSRP